MRTIGLLASVATCSFVAVACSSTSAAPPPADGGNATEAAPPDGGMVDCTTDPLAEMYAANMQQSGMSNTFKFVLVKDTSTSEQGQMVDGPPALGNNTWIIKVLDKTGMPLTDVTFPVGSGWSPGWPVGVYPYMPHHGHPSSSWPMVTNNMDGTYTVSNLYLYMAGLWQITINAKSGTQTDSAIFGFCIPG